MLPLFSIVIVVYNSEKTIEQAILSVLGQTFKDYEFIIIDGCSTDGTLDIIKKYSEKIKYISEPDYGIYDAMNKAIKMASGRYIQFLGADDCFYNTQVLEKVAKKIDDYKRPDFLCCGRISVDENDCLERYECDNHVAIIENPKIMFFCPHTSLFVKTVVMKQELFDIRFKISADYHFILKCYYKLHKSFLFYNIPIAYIGNAGVSHTAYQKGQEENKIIYKELGLENLEIYCKERSFWREKIKNICKFFGVYFLFRKIINVYFRKNMCKHHCKWEHCRWCGR